MVRVTVLRGFRDLKERVDRAPGETFMATPERAAFIASALPGFISWEQAPKPAPAGPVREVPVVDLSKLKVAELRELAERRGVEVPAKAKKAELIKLIEG